MIGVSLRLTLTTVLALGCGIEIAALPTRPATAATVYERLLQLEQKTNYFRKINRKLSRSYVRPSTTTAEQPAACQTSIGMRFDPVIQLGGTAYTWLTTTVNYVGVPPAANTEDLPWFATFWQPGGSNAYCTKSVPISQTNGSFTVKQYCSFDVSSGDKFTFGLTIHNSVGGDCVTNYVQSVATTAKFTLIEIPEPP